MTDTDIDLAKLLHLIRRLRAPDGCPWDQRQQLGDLRAYLLEEAHETAAAIDSGDWGELLGELGDLLFQVVFLACLAEEAGAFRLHQVIDGIHAKMVDRHPHVFGDQQLSDARAVHDAWERRKARQRPAERSLLEGVATSLPALTAAYRMTQKAAGVGFDWPDAASVLGKIREEIQELEEAMADGQPPPIREEVGDLLFAVANLARKLDLDPEAALAAANIKFRRRFAGVEEGLRRRRRPLDQATLQEMDELWHQVKEAERATGGEGGEG